MKTWRWMMTMAASGLVLGACVVTSGPGTDDEGDGGNDSTSTSSQGGSGVTSTTGGGMCTHDFEFASEACGACADNGCCPELEACSADEICFNCATGNSTTECETSTTFGNLSNCLQSQCANACSGGGEGTPVCNSPWAVESEACGLCLGNDSACCAAFTDCDPDSVNPEQAACGDCLYNEATECPEGAPYWDTIQACFSSTCASECGG